MLHFLLATALCLFIGERLVRYWSAWRRRRDERRYLAMLYPPPVLKHAPERPDDSPTEREFDLARWRTHWHARQMVRRG